MRQVSEARPGTTRQPSSLCEALGQPYDRISLKADPGLTWNGCLLLGLEYDWASGERPEGGGGEHPGADAQGREWYEPNGREEPSEGGRPHASEEADRPGRRVESS